MTLPCAWRLNGRTVTFAFPTPARDAYAQRGTTAGVGGDGTLVETSDTPESGTGLYPRAWAR